MKRRALLGFICLLLALILISTELPSLYIISYSPSLIKKNMLQEVNASRSDILIVASDDGIYYHKGTSLAEFEAILRSAKYNYDLWEKSKKGNPPLSILLNYKLVIWTCGDYSWKSIDRIDANVLSGYIKSGGNLLIEGEYIATEHPPSYSNLRSEVLHVLYYGYYGISVHGLRVVSPGNEITRGLPYEFNWTVAPHHLAQIIPSEEAYDVLRFFNRKYPDYVNTTAVNVFDGTSEGVGSVIYYAFSIFSLPESERHKLVINSIRWLLRFNLAIVVSKIIHASPGSVYFLYTDPKFLTVNETFSIVAGAAVYGTCKNLQHQVFNTTKNLLLEYGSINSTELNEAYIVLLGSPIYNLVVKYYEDAGLAPIRLYESLTQFIVLNQTGDIIISIDKDEVESGLKDIFVIYVFKDEGNTFLVMYGLGWKGMWAAGIYLAKEISINLSQYSKTCYIFYFDEIKDGTVDRIPQISEIQEVVSKVSGPIKTFTGGPSIKYVK